MTGYLLDIGHGIVIMNTRPEHAVELETLQKIVFPTLAVQSLLKREHYLNHIKIFPEGQFVAIKDNRVVGMTTTIRYELIPGDRHSFDEVIDGGFLSTHQPDALWLYGMDIGTHPDCRGFGIAKFLYDARQNVVRSLNLKGQYTYGMLSGYGALKKEMTAELYYKELLEGKRKDPTVSRQIANGFKPIELVSGYIDDPVCDGYCVLLVKENKNYNVN